MSSTADLPRPPGRIREVMAAHPRAVDGIVAGVYVLLSVGAGILGAYIPEDGMGDVGFHIPTYLQFPQLIMLVAMVVTISIALILRRRYPVLSLVTVIIWSVVAPDSMVPVAAVSLAELFLLYSVPVYRSVRAGWAGYGLALLATVPALAVDIRINGFSLFDGGQLAAFVTLVLLLMFPVVLGVNAGNRRRYTEAIIDRAHQLAQERDQRARLAVAEERTRIAREMHDIVAHSVSVMVALSEGAAHVAEVQPAEAAKAMRQSAETGRSALAEMRRLIGVLRNSEEESADMAPMPGIDSIPDLVTSFRSAGLMVDLTLKGHPGDLEGSQGRELAVFRIVQEALTNTLRYAGPGSTASITIDQRAGSLDVRISDDGVAPGRSAPMVGVGSGQGLVGLAERIRVFGGELDFGPKPRGGWYVHATLPDEGEQNG